MKKTLLKINDTFKVLKVAVDCAVIGTGAAGYNAALRLSDYGVNDICIVTEGVNMGTSRNTGSDKQTYYKMNLCADYPDSPKDMAQDFFHGKCVDGDNAYVEASLSVPCFLHLCELGVPFPTNRLGEYVGYKTDHDVRARATSVGPLTSKMMTECLEKEVNKRVIPVLDKLQAVEFIKNKGEVIGVLCLNKVGTGKNDRFVAVMAKNVIMATGGPAGIYQDTVYPLGHAGSTGIALEAGVLGKNLTEWQYGLASTAPRWNVSGTYMQVLPRFVSVDENGKEYEFLNEYFDSVGTCLSKIFKKGYEWPFDSKKVLDGSSVIDLLVFKETALKNRKVYLDFRKNPYGLENLPYDELEPEAKEYLQNAGACFGTPIERLQRMNAPAVELYKDKGVDLTTEMLEIALCAQHNNGGLEVDLWWQTNIKHLFACGEVAGTHGVYRPGGSALNAGQVGSMRASQYISAHNENDKIGAFNEITAELILKQLDFSNALLSDTDNLEELNEKSAKAMSEAGGAIRNPALLVTAIDECEKLLKNFSSVVKVHDEYRLWSAYRFRDALISRIAYMSAMKDYVALGGKSRGSALYSSKTGEIPQKMDECFRFELDQGELNDKVQNYNFPRRLSTLRNVRPLPEGGGFFENVWRSYRENKNID